MSTKQINENPENIKIIKCNFIRCKFYFSSLLLICLKTRLIFSFENKKCFLKKLDGAVLTYLTQNSTALISELSKNQKNQNNDQVFVNLKLDFSRPPLSLQSLSLKTPKSCDCSCEKKNQSMKSFVIFSKKNKKYFQI